MANSLTVISECLPAPGQNSPYFARLRVWSCPAVAVIVGRKASCLRGSVCASVRRRDGQALQTVSDAITCQASAHKDSHRSTDTYSRWRLLIMSGKPRSALVKVFAPVADIQLSTAPVQFALSSRFYRFRVATLAMPLALCDAGSNG